MHIEHRNPTPEYPHGDREEKTLLVLGWLLEFRWSSFELLATRLGLRSKTSYKFFRALVEEGLIQIFKSVPANLARCFLLTWRGALPAPGRRARYFARPHLPHRRDPRSGSHPRPGRAGRRAPTAPAV